MNSKKITLIAGAIFYTTMLVLSITAKKIHIASLPKVTVESFESERFEDEGADPINYKWNLVIPQELYDNQKVYIIIKEIVNGEERNIAKEVKDIEIGQSNDSGYEVIRGLSSIDQIITTGQEMIQDGCEVYVEE